jgi:hypothetical protein
MLSLGLWLVTGPGKAANSEREGADRAADN